MLPCKFRKNTLAKMRQRKRADEPSVPFCDKGGMTARMTDFSVKKNRNGAKSIPTWQQTQFSIRVALGCKVALKCNPRSVCNRPTNCNLFIFIFLV